MEAAMLCKLRIRHGETFSESNEIRKSKHECVVEAHESTRKRSERTPSKDHEDHIAEKGFNSLSHHKLVHKFIPRITTQSPNQLRNSTRRKSMSSQTKTSSPSAPKVPIASILYSSQVSLAKTPTDATTLLSRATWSVTFTSSKSCTPCHAVKWHDHVPKDFFWGHDEGTDDIVSSTMKTKVVAPIRCGLEDFSYRPSVFQQMWTSKEAANTESGPVFVSSPFWRATFRCHSFSFFFLERLIQSPVFMCYCAALTCRHIHIHTRVKKKKRVHPMPQAMRIPEPKAAVDKEWEKLEKLPALQMTKVNSKRRSSWKHKKSKAPSTLLPWWTSVISRTQRWSRSSKITKDVLYSGVT